ncbi:SGNH/GDSL hydrolase family protein [Flavobacterium luminosum]|uniref:G-D-S-L family lipolytic protein n=1 Tax=Flavobacterium luminosum TaxID=2949086 RepID=A0ABT0TQ26_9FLAO|nr:G-D-S-L family lipolytic protein [Flavobacterium sp. HXWNR70]MCL9809601.1 G-D-S-L family lipolytic protein [Flavobacterium sp. HXWNR70]
MIKNFKWLFLVSLTFMACNDDDTAAVTEEPVSPGTANFSKYVALGDSFAAGYSDNALFKLAQETSYPSILATQFSAAGGGVFTVPYMVDNIGGFSSGGAQVPGFGTRLYFGKAQGSEVDEPLSVAGVSGTDISSKLTGTFSNLGVPGAKCIHLVMPGYANYNPYFKRFASDVPTTVMADALTQNPTFFSLWIGGNDVLGYALAGGDATINPLTPSAGPIGVGFDASYNELINNLTANGRKGVIANLPYITSLPQFTYLKPSLVDPYKYYVDGDEKKVSPKVSIYDVGTINQINSILNFLDQVLTNLGEENRINALSTTQKNPVLIKDETLTNYGTEIRAAALASGDTQLMALANYLGATFGNVRQTKTGDLIPLLTSGVIGTNASVPNGVPLDFAKYGITYPLEDKHVLIPTEVDEIIAATDAYNATIKQASVSKDLAFLDAKVLMEKLLTVGVSDSGYALTADFVLGGAFSLDGIHPSPRGYALIANQFAKVINEKYGSTLKNVNIGTYRILFPKAL